MWQQAAQIEMQKGRFTIALIFGFPELGANPKFIEVSYGNWKADKCLGKIHLDFTKIKEPSS